MLYLSFIHRSIKSCLKRWTRQLALCDTKTRYLYSKIIRQNSERDSSINPKDGHTSFSLLECSLINAKVGQSKASNKKSKGIAKWRYEKPKTHDQSLVANSFSQK